MNDRINAKQRTLLLKELREQHQETVARTQELLKNQKRIYKEINQAIEESPKTVPDIAAEIDLDPHTVLWHLTALKKYGLIAETGMSGEYFLYSPVKEAKR